MVEPKVVQGGSGSHLMVLSPTFLVCHMFISLTLFRIEMSFLELYIHIHLDLRLAFISY